MNNKRNQKKNYFKGVTPIKDNKEFKNKTKEGFVNSKGIVLEAYSGGRFSVELENGVSIKAVLSGKIRQNFIKILPGDKVEVELSLYDLTNGRIVQRLKR